MRVKGALPHSFSPQLQGRDSITERQKVSSSQDICQPQVGALGLHPADHLLDTSRCQYTVEIRTLRFQKGLKKDIYKTKGAEKSDKLQTGKSLSYFLISSPSCSFEFCKD